jgi:hypothetical protein
LGFGFEPGLKIKIGLGCCFEHLLDARKRAAGRSGAGLNGLVGAVKIIPGEGLNVGAKNEVRVAFPDFMLMLLGGAYGAADYLEDVGRSAAAAIFNADGYANDMRRAEVSRRAAGNLGNEAAIGKAPGSDFNGFEQSRERATCANRFREIPMRKDYGLAIGQVSGDDGERNLQILELTGLKDLLDELAQAVIASQAEAGNSPAGDIAETNCAAGRNDARERRAAGVGCAQNAADACPRNARDRDLIFLENLQNPEMREAAGKASTQSEAKTCPWGLRWPSVQRRMSEARHAPRMPTLSCWPNGSGVLKLQYERTCVQKKHNSLRAVRAVPSY